MLRSLFLLLPTLTLFLTAGTSDARAVQSTNLERIRFAAQLLSDSLLSHEQLPSTVCLNIVDHPADWIVEQALTDVGARIGRPVEACAPPFSNEMLIALLGVGVRYVELEDEDFYRREIEISLSASLPLTFPEGRVERRTRRHDILVADTIEAVDASALEQPEYPLTIAVRVERNDSSFWNRIAEPAIVIGTSVVMLVLLFTTRSQ